jgi:hypothetical protein
VTQEINMHKFEIIGHARDHFSLPLLGTQITSHTAEEFEESLAVADVVWVDGAVDFVKHVLVENFTDARSGVAEITHENEHMLTSAYEARHPTELPCLVRWFPRARVEAPLASHLEVILYSREQLLKEGYVIETAWGIVAILASMSGEASPPVPATQARNALGIQGGGNGAAIDPTQYAAGVAYWTRYALVR